jgi:NodT family efflux transporter outer membrane factor (OMF) lipoprotein
MTALRLLPALAAAVLALAGCVVGPNYRAPSAPQGAAGPLLSASPVETTTAATPDDWWRLYSDPRLDGYVAEAFAANADLAAAEANLSAARAVLDASRAGLYPSTTTKAGAIRGRDPTTNEILEIVGAKPQTLWLYDALLDASYELDLFGRVRRSIEAAGADAEAVAAARDNLKVTVAAETARAYAQVCTLGEEVAVAHHALDVVSRELQITIHRRDAGAGSDFDVVRGQLLVAQVRATIPPLEGQRRAALFQLAAVLGRTPANAPTEALACAKPPKLVSLIPVGDGAALLRRRPDVRQADRKIAAATARIGVATADLYPRISLTGFYGGAAPTLAELPKNAGLVWGVGPMISWSFPIQTLPRARIRQAKASEAAALADFDSVVLEALKETEQALTAYSAELEHNRALGEAQEKARIGYELAHGQFLAGSTTQLDLLASEQQLVSAESSVAASDAAITQDQIAVFKALGGGWATPAPPAAVVVPVSH